MVKKRVKVKFKVKFCKLLFIDSLLNENKAFICGNIRKKNNCCWFHNRLIRLKCNIAWVNNLVG